MAKPRKQTSVLVKCRLDKGIGYKEIAQLAGLGQASIGKIERGEAVKRTTMRKYLQAYGIDLADRSTWPQGLQIIDKGVNVHISSDQ